MSTVQILWTLVAAQMLLIGLAWTAVIPISRGNRAGVAGLVAFNVVLAVSLLLIGFRDFLPYLVGHTVSNLLALWALVAIVQAGDQILDAHISQRELWIAMALGGFGILVFGFSPDTADWRAFVLFITLSWMLYRNGVVAWRIQPEPHLRSVVKSIAAICLASAALLFARAVAGMLGHASIEFNANDGFTLLLPYVVLALVSLVNLGFAYLAVSTVVIELRQSARTEEATGLLNRKALTDEITRAWAKFVKTRQPFALICLDIDGFRSVNLAYGYPFGNNLLKEVAGALRGLLRPGDKIGSAWDGKMVAILSNASLAEARGIAERMRARVADFQHMLTDGRIKVSASLGVAVSLESDPSEESVLARANAHLAGAKATGRDRVQWENADAQNTQRAFG